MAFIRSLAFFVWVFAQVFLVSAQLDDGESWLARLGSHDEADEVALGMQF